MTEPIPGLAVTSLLYVSNSLIGTEDNELERILSVARSRNAILEVSGALIFTGSHFAQVLEGKAAAIEELMLSIAADARHSSVKVIQIVQLAERRFGSWSMAYSGPSLYVDRHIKPLFQEAFEPQTRPTAANALLRLMQEFTEAGGVEAAWASAATPSPSVVARIKD